MSKLYVFGIGGTGSRVLKALTMLLASGVQCNDDIVPIIIDPDSAAADLTRTVSAMNNYVAIRKHLSFTTNSNNKFFGTDISQQVQNFLLPLDNNTANLKFDAYIGLNTMSGSNSALVQMLFSENNLNSGMTVGFKGNPNIGSVVLNQFDTSKAFINFANGFQQGDKIFIISSIFGGTGASGFPLLLKTLRGNTQMPNFALINGATIGAVTVLPYFNVQQSAQSAIDSATFISKTKSALSYYDRNISGNGSIDALYYVADNVPPTYQNNDGGVGQQNDAHFIELASALAVLDFSNLGNGNGPVYKEFGIANDSQSIIFSDLGPVSRQLIEKPLTQFLLLRKYLENCCQAEYKNQPWAKSRDMEGTFINGQFVDTLKSFLDDYYGWLHEMANNKRGFTPLQLKPGHKLDIVVGVDAQRGSWRYKNYALFDNLLNKQKIDKSSSKEQQFTELFYGATSELVKKLFNIQ